MPKSWEKPWESLNAIWVATSQKHAQGERPRAGEHFMGIVIFTNFDALAKPTVELSLGLNLC